MEQAVACHNPRLSYLSTGDKYLTSRTASRGCNILVAELGWGPGTFYTLGSNPVLPAASSVCYLFPRVGGSTVEKKPFGLLKTDDASHLMERDKGSLGGPRGSTGAGQFWAWALESAGASVGWVRGVLLKGRKRWRQSPPPSPRSQASLQTLPLELGSPHLPEPGCLEERDGSF